MSTTFNYTKQFNFYTDMEIETIIKKSEYSKSYNWFSTGIPNDNPKLITPDNNFEDKLVQSGIYYFAYIKFFKINGNRYGLVAGKTKSKLVNPKGHSDVNFTKNLKYAPKTKWNAKEFLNINKLDWEKEIILIIIPKLENQNDKEARKIEKWLQQEFNLFGS